MMLSELWPTVSAFTLPRLFNLTKAQKQLLSENRQLNDTISRLKIFVDDILLVQLALTPYYIKRVVTSYIARRSSGIEHDENEESDLAGALMAAIGASSTAPQDEEVRASLVTKWHYLGYLQICSVQVLVLTLLFFKYRVQSKQAQAYTLLIRRRILDL
jgi:hypothetical protein